MKKLIIDQAICILAMGFLMCVIPFLYDDVAIVPLTILYAGVMILYALAFRIAFFFPLDCLTGPRTDDAFFSCVAAVYKCDTFRKYYYMEMKFMCKGK